MVTLAEYEEITAKIVEIETKQLETVKQVTATLQNVFKYRLADHTFRGENDGVWEVQSALHRLEVADRDLTATRSVYGYIAEMFNLFSEEQKQIAYNNVVARLNMYLGK